MDIKNLKSTYKDFILNDKELFLNEINYIKSKINLENLSNNPILVYSQNKRNALYYVLGMFLSLKSERILNYAVITGQTLINQHFMTEANRDNELYNRIFYTDITFVSLSQYDYTNEYLESQIIDLIEFRKINKKMTIVSFDITNSGQSYINMTKKLHNYFSASGHQIIDIAKNGKTAFDKPSVKQSTKEIPEVKKRIV